MGHVSSKTRSPGQILEHYFLNITSDLDPQVLPVVYKAMKKGNSLKSSLSGERSRALWALLFRNVNNFLLLHYKLERICLGPNWELNPPCSNLDKTRNPPYTLSYF